MSDYDRAGRLFVAVPRDYRGNEHRFEYRPATAPELVAELTRLGFRIKRGGRRVTLIAPKAELPSGYVLPSTAPIPENPEASW